MAFGLRGDTFLETRTHLYTTATNIRIFAEDLDETVREEFTLRDQYNDRHFIRDVLRQWEDLAFKVELIASLPRGDERPAGAMDRTYAFCMKYAPRATKTRLLHGANLSVAIGRTLELLKDRAEIPEKRVSTNEIVKFGSSYFDAMVPRYVETLVDSYHELDFRYFQAKRLRTAKQLHRTV